MHHPINNFMSKWHLVQPLQRNMQKPNAYLLDSRPEQKSLVTYHTLWSMYVCVWLVNTLTYTAPIGSLIIWTWSRADICEQWERNLSFSSADVGGAGTRDEPLRTSAWEARGSCFQQIFPASRFCLNNILPVFETLPTQRKMMTCFLCLTILFWHNSLLFFCGFSAIFTLLVSKHELAITSGSVMLCCNRDQLALASTAC